MSSSVKGFGAVEKAETERRSCDRLFRKGLRDGQGRSLCKSSLVGEGVGVKTFGQLGKRENSICMLPSIEGLEFGRVGKVF